MTSIWLMLILSLNGILLLLWANPLLSKEKTITHYDPQLKREHLPKAEMGEIDPTQALIVGYWRGYKETPDFTIYYGYEFRPNGVYVAKHRVYEQERTILEQYWQGKWSFDGKILSLEGTVSQEEPTRYKYIFRLAADHLLYYENGDLPKPYLPGKMGKVSEKSQ
ncbi:hypothetical protein [Gloeothece verrucosa]|uniref:Uncharacterized protein n=1 Tax=Gloeothece verrucosa (strain PCC 7822) TaxID=497965 RepID=E0U5Q7_GLOV7|nr:hypothetical protein [Gloeothece verrucosa]ADN15898.1 hypothetical protein Cyan7822_3973 [Gloeothece verrucosa PCC 7822]